MILDRGTRASNQNLNKAKAAKNDEFYTFYADVEAEVSNYADALRGKRVHLCCDDPEFSQFWAFFSANFDALGLAEVITSHYTRQGRSYSLRKTAAGTERTELQGNGDFASEEVRELMRQADVVCTNPPFSLYREFMHQLHELGRDFLVVGPMIAIGYKVTQRDFIEGRLHTGYTQIGAFATDAAFTETKAVRGLWFTTLPKERRKTYQVRTKYTPERHLQLKPYDAIVVNRSADVPYDYDGIMAVPVSFMTFRDTSRLQTPDGEKEISLLGFSKITTAAGNKKFDRLLVSWRTRSELEAGGRHTELLKESTP